VLDRAEWRAGIHERPVLSAQRVVTRGEHVWVVREADMSLAANAPGPQCLLLECARSIRSTWTYPREWAMLDDPDLLQLFS
jgi:hypothetical protein